MKYITLSWVILLTAIIISSSSCTEKRKVISENDIRFDTISITNVYHLNNDSTQPSCNLKIKLIYPIAFNNKDILPKLQQVFLTSFLNSEYGNMSPKEALDKYNEQYVNNYKEDAKIYFEEKEKDSSVDFDNYFSYYENIYNDVTFNKANILSFQVIQSNYKAGANSYEQYNNYVVDLTSGKVINEEDIFRPGYEGVLNTIFKDKLKIINKIQNISDLSDLGYFGVEEISPNNNFLVDENQIIYIFNKGEYSLLQLDEIRIVLPYNEISALLKEESPISVFIGK